MYWIIGFLGLALAAAPFFFGYTSDTPALWTSLVIGALVMIVSYFEGMAHDKERWEYWTVVVIGAIAVTAPFILGFAQNTVALTISVIAGVVLAVFAGGTLMRMGRV